MTQVDERRIRAALHGFYQFLCGELTLMDFGAWLQLHPEVEEIIGKTAYNTAPLPKFTPYSYPLLHPSLTILATSSRWRLEIAPEACYNASISFLTTHIVRL